MPHSCCHHEQSRQRSGAAANAGRDQGESAACSDTSLPGKTQAGKLSDAFPAEIFMAPAVCLGGVGHPMLSTWLSFFETPHPPARAAAVDIFIAAARRGT